MLGGSLISFFSSDPIGLLIFSAIINGVAAAPFLIITMLISRDKDMMGDYHQSRGLPPVGRADPARGRRAVLPKPFCRPGHPQVAA